MPLVRKPPGEPEPPPQGQPTLTDADPDLRRRAARQMGQPEHVEALGAALKTESEPSVREAILSALCQIGTPEAAAMIAPGMRADNASVRRAALDALRSMSQAVATLLPGLLADPDADVRILSCEIARELPAFDATAMLCAVLNTELTPNVCTAAIEVLTDIGTASAIGPLKGARARFPSEPFLQFAIDTAIERISAASGDGRE